MLLSQTFSSMRLAQTIGHVLLAGVYHARKREVRRYTEWAMNCSTPFHRSDARNGGSTSSTENDLTRLEVFHEDEWGF